MGFAMHRLSCFVAWRRAGPKYLASAFILPVPQVLYPVLVLNLKIFRVSTGDRFTGQSLHFMVSIHIERHRKVLLSTMIKVLTQQTSPPYHYIPSIQTFPQLHPGPSAHPPLFL